jgi:hypothetical protein
MEQKQPVGIAVDLGIIVLVGVMLGIVLIIIGVGVGNSGNKGVYLAGLAITTLSLFAGGFLQKEENNVVRLGLFLAGAIILAYLVSNGAVLGLLGALSSYG